MTLIGILLIIIGMVVGLTSPVDYNGQWLLGVIIAVVGLTLVIIHSVIAIERNKK